MRSAVKLSAFDRSELATSLRVIRAERRLTQGQVAKLSGLSINTIGRVEGTAPVYIETIRTLERTLGEDLLDVLY